MAFDLVTAQLIQFIITYNQADLGHDVLDIYVSKAFDS